VAFGTVAAMDNVARAADILKRVGRMVEGFLTDLAETAPDEMDCLALEKSAMAVVIDLGLSLMKGAHPPPTAHAAIFTVAL
jgi:hypothetical protein